MAKYKLTAKQALAFINQAGGDVELVADDQEVKDLKLDDLFADIDASRSRIFKPTLEAELRDSLTTQLAGKFGGDLRAKLRRLSNGVLKTSDLDNLKDDEALQKFVEAISGQKDQSLDEIRAQLKKAGEEWEAEKQKLLEDEGKKYAELQTRYRERDIDALYETELGLVPRTGGNLKAQAQLAKAYVRGKYKDHYDDSKSAYELRDFTNAEKLAMNGNVAIQLKDVLTEFAKETGILKTDTRDEDPNKTQQENKEGNPTKTTHFGGSADFNNDMNAFEKMVVG